jgi:putative ATPase
MRRSTGSIAYADGDARRLLNTLETLAVAARAGEAPHIADEWLLRCSASACAATTRAASSSTTRSARCTSRCAAADPDAALYWFVRMLDGGADPRYIARRLIRMAVEDVGLADPRALRLALDAAEVYERLGTPEGELALAECLVYLAIAPKSNAVYKAYNAVRALVRKDSTRPVPMHLRNAPTKLMKDLDYGKGYRYAHDEEGGFAAGETYLPEGMRAGLLRPVDRGLEIRIGEKLRELRRLNAEGND